MRFHKEGQRSLVVVTIVAIIITIIADKLFSNISVLRYGAYIIALFILFGVIYFFRLPKMAPHIDPKGVVAGANGTIVQIIKIFEPEYLKEERLLVSIFMSPLDVHVNRNPVGGLVKYVKYHPGKHLIAKHPKASTENEHTSVVIENSSGVEILFRQIAGTLARRIVFYLKKGDLVEQGEEMGFIKFGSRVDIFLPLNARVLVKNKQKVRGGRTLIAKL